MGNEILDLRRRYTNSRVLKTAQALTGSWVAFGPEINTGLFNRINLFAALDINDSVNARIRITALMATGGISYQLPVYTVGATETKIAPVYYYEFDVDADQNLWVAADLPINCIAQLEIQAGTAGASPGTLAASYILECK
jgi:hypothetical protein